MITTGWAIAKASAGHSDVETAVPRHGPKNRGSWDPHLGQTARAGRPEAGPKVTPPTTQAKNRSLYMFGDRYPLQEIKAWLARASIRTAIKPTLGRLA